MTFRHEGMCVQFKKKAYKAHLRSKTMQFHQHQTSLEPKEGHFTSEDKCSEQHSPKGQAPEALLFRKTHPEEKSLF